MAVEIRAMQDLAQSAMQTLRTQRLKRKKYRYYSGYQELNLAIRDEVLHLDATVAHPVQSVSVLHGSHIVLSVAPLPVDLVKNGHDESHRIHAEISLDPLLDRWQGYRELASSDEEPESSVPDSDDADDNQVTLENDLYAGTVRLALTF
ncbi:MAG: hypothetical protein RSA54_14735, partial [Glutamicibacter sp.]